jgi:ABC-2 type transport system ATP-binding protein
VVEPILEVRTDDAPRAVDALAATPGVLDAAMFGRALHVTVDDADEGARIVRKALSDAGREVSAIQAVQPSLEDVFVSLVRAEGGAVVG